MKHLAITIFMAIVMVTLAVLPVKAQEVRNLTAPQSFREKLESIITGYLELETPIRRGDVSGAQKKSNALIVYLDEMSEVKLEGVKRADWMSSRLNLLKLLDDIEKAPNIKDQRAVFSDLGHTMAKILKRFGPVRMNLYAYRCSDALGQGGYWIDNRRPSVNPFDSEAPDCASMQEQIVSYKEQE